MLFSLVKLHSLQLKQLELYHPRACHGSGGWSPASHNRDGFNSRSVNVGFVVEKVAGTPPPPPRVLPVSLIIPPVLHTHI
jgi:hypothetical protein